MKTTIKQPNQTKHVKHKLIIMKNCFVFVFEYILISVLLINNKEQTQHNNKCLGLGHVRPVTACSAHSRILSNNSMDRTRGPRLEAAAPLCGMVVPCLHLCSCWLGPDTWNTHLICGLGGMSKTCRSRVEIFHLDPKSSFRRIDTGIVNFRTSRSQRDHSRNLKSFCSDGTTNLWPLDNSYWCL